MQAAESKGDSPRPVGQSMASVAAAPTTQDTSPQDNRDDGGDRLSWAQRRFLGILGLPAFGVAFAYTVVGTYLPVLLAELSGPAVTGILIGGEGVVALIIPVVVGGWSDSTRSRIGRRLPFILGGAVLMVLALLGMPLGAGSLFLIIVSLVLFFLGYFGYYTPYYALFPDLVPAAVRGRSQGIQGGFRSAGLLLALVGGGFLLSVWRPLPFAVGALAVVAVTVGLYFGLRKRTGRERGADQPSAGGGLRTDLGLVRENPTLRYWIAADALWEGAVAALKTFVVLYFTRGLGMSLRSTATSLALVGLAALVAAPVAGKLADRFGARRIMQVAVWGFALGLTPTLVTTNTAFLVAIVPVAFAAVVLMTLPYTLLMRLLPQREAHGAGASLFGFAKGIGVLIGPLLAGVAITELDRVPFGAFQATAGYAGAFGVAMILLVASIPLLRRIKVA
ncbi:MAG: MFS transporter [Actinobacteria bacterium]|nr:MFS transporter [Actinomycetota bacterium]